MNRTRHALRNMPEPFECPRMETDSRLNNDTMKGESTVRFTQMTAVRFMYEHIRTVTGYTLYIHTHIYVCCCIREQNPFMHYD